MKSLFLGTNTSVGYCYGHIIDKPIDSKGFGFDPLFIPDGYSQTFGQLSDDIKNIISHRAKALDKCISYLRKWINDEF